MKINHSNNITIQSVELISPQNSPISATGNFNETTNKMGLKEFKLPIKVFHFDDISNKTYNYSLYLSYMEGTNKSLQQVTVPFEWRIIMKDLPWLNYLWIVMAGVVVSRFITFIADTNKNEPLSMLIEPNHYGLHSLL